MPRLGRARGWAVPKGAIRAQPRGTVNTVMPRYSREPWRTAEQIATRLAGVEKGPSIYHVRRRRRRRVLPYWSRPDFEPPHSLGVFPRETYERKDFRTILGKYPFNIPDHICRMCQKRYKKRFSGKNYAKRLRY